MDDMIETSIWTILRLKSGQGLLLKIQGEDKIIPFYVTQEDVHALHIALDEKKLKAPQPNRPEIHELLMKLLEIGGFLLQRMEIWDFRDDIYWSRLVLARGDRPGDVPFIMDARSQDALALAAHAKCPILVSRRVAEAAGIPINTLPIFNFLPNPAPLPPRKVSGKPENNRRELLREQLEEAVAREEYERAAEIRDRLRSQDTRIPFPPLAGR
jgi:bifunctional DNase/RNase